MHGGRPGRGDGILGVSNDLRAGPSQAEVSACRSPSPAGSITAKQANLSGSTFHAVNLSQATFEDVNLRGVLFRNVALTGASIRDACLGNVTIEGAGYDGMRIEEILVTELLRGYRQRSTS